MIHVSRALTFAAVIAVGVTAGAGDVEPALFDSGEQADQCAVAGDGRVRPFGESEAFELESAWIWRVARIGEGASRFEAQLDQAAMGGEVVALGLGVRCGDDVIEVTAGESGGARVAVNGKDVTDALEARPRTLFALAPKHTKAKGVALAARLARKKVKVCEQEGRACTPDRVTVECVGRSLRAEVGERLASAVVAAYFPEEADLETLSGQVCGWIAKPDEELAKTARVRRRASLFAATESP